MVKNKNFSTVAVAAGANGVLHHLRVRVGGEPRSFIWKMVLQ